MIRTAMDKIALSAVIDRLVYGDDATFKIDDAAALNALLPQGAKLGLLARFCGFSFKTNTQGRSTQGYAAGVGNVTLKDKAETFSFDSRGRRVVRVGQWKLCRNGSNIEIEQVLDTDAEKSVRLCYLGSQPIRMDRLVYVGAWVQVGWFRMWKSPV